MKRKWAVKPLPEFNAEDFPEYPALIRRLLAVRQFREKGQIEKFLNPNYEELHSPFLFKDMGKAVERIWQAIQSGEKIAIYADYDADAITACSVMYLALKKLGAVVDYYIPDRFSEGYGMNPEAIGKIAERDAKLIITVDCGINAVGETAAANRAGMDVIITDHHEVTGPLPEAFAIINPKNPLDSYPFPYLTGVGVAFKLVQALFSDSVRLTAANAVPGWEKWLLDLVAIGTVADCQTLLGENRILVSFGLKVIAKTKWLGLRALLEISGISQRPIDTYVLGFMVAPRINAAGRIKHADIAFRLLITGDPAEASAYAQELNSLNVRRQELTERVLSEAREQIELIIEKRVLLAAGQDWPKGVVGLVAGRLAEEYGRPVLVMEKGEEFATGSARAAGSFDLVAALNYSKDLLSKYGGHTQAAGFTLPVGNIPVFHQKLLEYADTSSAADPDPVLELDAELFGDDVNLENFDIIDRFGPFGFGNPRPKFACFGADILELRLVGADNRHLKLTLGIGGRPVAAIAFNQGFLGPKLALGRPINVAAELSANEWNGNREIQLRVIDIQVPDIKT
ncbi:MAG: single-stranded-DNA-specific exonuclease RecJ [Candidatus Saccharibacteria bacterium]